MFMKKRSQVMRAMRVLKALSGLALLAAFLSSSRCATTALSTRSKKGDVKVFELGQRIPRNSKILGFAEPSGFQGNRYLAGSWGSIGSCGYKPILRIIKKRTKAQGGDAIAILYVGKPSKWNRCFTIKAYLLDTIDISGWPRVGLTEEEIRRDLVAGGRTLDEIEGIWASHGRSEVIMDAAAVGWAGDYEASQNMGDPLGTGVWRVLPSVIQAMEQLSPEEQTSYLVAIVKAAGDPDYPYAAYILDPEIPEWKPGFLKARFRKLPDSSGYEAKWYGSTFQSDLREFHPDESGALKTKVVIEQGLKYSIEQTLTKVYPPQRQ
jgi:hypothetical protein